ncbi:MAG: hypothetical protein ABI634_01925 [Acidobacteriota bacterium]
MLAQTVLEFFAAGPRCREDAFVSDCALDTLGFWQDAPRAVK